MQEEAEGLARLEAEGVVVGSPEEDLVCQEMGISGEVEEGTPGLRRENWTVLLAIEAAQR